MATLDAIDLGTSDPSPYTRPYTADDRAWARDLLDLTGHRYRAIRGELVETSELAGLVLVENSFPTGLLTIREHHEELELATMVSEHHDEDILARLLAAALANIGPDCRRVWSVCYNAEFRTQQVLQRGGLRLCAVRPGALDRLRRHVGPETLRDEINSVPLRDELEFELLV